MLVSAADRPGAVREYGGSFFVLKALRGGAE